MESVLSLISFFSEEKKLKIKSSFVRFYVTDLPRH